MTDTYNKYMNIFVTDPDPEVSAKNLDDVRLNKMILESCQMLAYALAANGCPELELPYTKAGKPYKVNGPHKNHPCSIWAGRTRANYQWLLEHFIALCREKFRRTGKPHASYSNLLRLIEADKYIPEGPLEQFQNSSLYKSQEPISAYKKTMCDKWDQDKLEAKTNPHKKPPTWTNAQKPDWYN